VTSPRIDGDPGDIDRLGVGAARHDVPIGQDLEQGWLEMRHPMRREVGREIVHPTTLVPPQVPAITGGQADAKARVTHDGDDAAGKERESVGPPKTSHILPPMYRLIPTALLLCALPAASAQSVMAIGYGVQHRYDDGVRDLTQSGDFKPLDGGHHVLLGFSAPERGFVGWPWFDMEWSRNSGEGTRLDTIGVTYVERVPLWLLWLGGGVGSAYHDVRIDTDDNTRRDQKWRFAAKAVVGAELFKPLYIEAAYFYAGSAGGEKMDYVTLDIGLRF